MGLEIAHMHRIALANVGVRIGHRLPGLDGGDHPAAGAALQRLDRLHMVAVAVGDEDVGELPASLAQRCEDRPLLRRVDGRASPRIGIVDQSADIVVEAAKDVNLGWHGGTLS
jgi:hypothetical protein